MMQFSDVVGGRGDGAFVEDPERSREVGAAAAVLPSAEVLAPSTGATRRISPRSTAGDIAVEGLDVRAEAAGDGLALRDPRAPGFNGATVHLRQDGKVWITK